MIFVVKFLQLFSMSTSSHGLHFPSFDQQFRELVRYYFYLLQELVSVAGSADVLDLMKILFSGAQVSNFVAISKVMLLQI